MLETKTAELDQQKLLITDQQLMLDEQTLQIGAFYTAEITGADEFDLYATIED